jgi:hypothetical protein
MPRFVADVSRGYSHVEGPAWVDNVEPIAATHDMKVKNGTLAQGVWQAQRAVGVCGEVKGPVHTRPPYSCKLSFI